MLAALEAEAVDTAATEAADTSADVKKKARKAGKNLKAAKNKQAISELEEQVQRLNHELAASKQRELALLRNSAAAPGTVAVIPQGGATPAEPVAGAEPPIDVAQAEAPEEKKEPVKNLGEVVVRSRQRIEKLQDVPLSISVVTGQDLEREQAMDLGAITKRAANITWNQGNQRTSSLAIRGIGKIGQTEAQDPSVGIIVERG